MNVAHNINFRKCGLDVVVWPQSKIVNPEAISVGNSVIIDDFVLLIAGKGVIIGDFVHIGAFTSIVGGGEVKIGDFAGLSGGVRVYTGNEDYGGESLTNPTVPAPYRIAQRSFVHIERHAIVGANTVILPGVTIGEGVAVGACSLVTKSLEPWTVYFGSPARPIKRRPKERILELEALLRGQVYDSHGKYIPKAEWPQLLELPR